MKKMSLLCFTWHWVHIVGPAGLLAFFASSQVSKPTRRFGSRFGRRPLSASDRSAGLIFAAQPQVRENSVSVFFFLKKLSLSFQGVF